MSIVTLNLLKAKNTIFCLCLGFTFGYQQLFCQNEVQQDYIADIIENLQGVEDFDFISLFETLEYLSNNPISLNSAEAEDFAELIFLDESKIQSIIDYREENGAFISIYELQAVPNLTISDIRQLSPFVTIANRDNQYQLPIKDMLVNGDHEIFTRLTRTLETVKGHRLNDKGVVPFEGDVNNLFLRYQYDYDGRLSFGLTAEKDSGESFFKRSNKQGFDYYSAHFHLKDVVKNMRDLVIGDYSISFGQGLIAHNFFGGTKSSLVTNIKKGGRTIKPYTSKNEANFFRGIASTYNLTSDIDISAFASIRKSDGNIIEVDTLEGEDILNAFSSLREDGFHRTTNEIEDENSISRFSTGSRIKLKKSAFSLGANILYERFSSFLQPQDQLYNKFRFRGQSLLNTSLDYTFKIRNINLFGEFASSQNGGIAFMSGALLVLNRKTDIAILYRDYGKEYQSLNSNSFGEGTSTNNERGIYIGLRHSINNKWTFSAYADQWNHPWIRFRVDAPSSGKEYLARLEYSTRYSFNAYVQYKYESKFRNLSDNETAIDIPINISLHKLRYFQKIPINRSFELRNRIEVSLFEDDEKSKGIFIAQDIHFNKRPFNLTSRIAYFNIDDFDARIYAYENDLLYSFFIPFFQNEGMRFYLNMKYKWNYKLTTEFRIARSHFFDIDTIGSGNNLINNNSRTDIKFQVRYRL